MDMNTQSIPALNYESAARQDTLTHENVVRNDPLNASKGILFGALSGLAIRFSRVIQK